MKTLMKQLNDLTTKADSLHADVQDPSSYNDVQDCLDEVQAFLNSSVDFLEFLGGQVESVKYIKKAIWLGYDIPLAMDCIHDEIWPVLDSHFERIEFEGDTMHVIKGELDVQFVQGIIAAFTKIHNPNDEDDFNITYEVVEVA